MTATGIVYSLSTEDTLLRGLVQLREKELLCDVDLVAEDETFPVHRVVLAAASPYFKAMFTGGFREKELDVITLKETSATGLTHVLNALYDSKVTISDDTVGKILSVAHLFHIDAVVGACEKYSCSNNTTYNCITFSMIAEKYELDKAIEACNEFILDNFEGVMKTGEFNKVSEGIFCKYISDSRLRLPNGEIEVFRAVVKWLETNETPKDMMAVMKHVRFPQIPANLLIDEVFNFSSIVENTNCRQLVLEALRFHSIVFSQPLIEGNFYQPRENENWLLFHVVTEHLDILCGIQKVHFTFYKLEAMHHSARRNPLKSCRSLLHSTACQS